MATLSIDGRSVPVDESFFQLTPEQQAAAIDYIAGSFRGGNAGTASIDGGRVNSVTVRPAGRPQPMPGQRAPAGGIARLSRGGSVDDSRINAARPMGQLQFTPEQQAAAMDEIASLFRGSDSGEPGTETNAAKPGAIDQRSALDFAAGLGKSAGVGLAKGTIGLAGTVGDAVAAGRWGLDYVAPGSVDKIDAATRAAGQTVDEAARGIRQALPSREKIAYAAKRLGVPVNQLAAAYDSLPGSVKFLIQNPFSTSADIRREVEKDTGPFYEPQTTLEGYVERFGEFAPAALSGPRGWLGRTASVVLPAIASETAGLETKGTWAEPWARAAAAAGTGFGVSRAARPAPTLRDIRELPADPRRAMNALPPDEQKREGLNRLLDILEASEKRKVAAGGADATAAQGVIEKFQEWRSGQNLHELTGILADPRADNRLRAIARMPTDSERAFKEARYLWSLIAASRVSERQKPADSAGGTR